MTTRKEITITMQINKTGPHKYKVPEYETGELCSCGMSADFRTHQPWWWRWSHRKKLWRT